MGTPNEENTTVGWPKMDDATYRVASVYIQDVMRYGRFTITPGVRYYHLDMGTYYAWFETGGTEPAWPTSGKEQTDDGFYPSLKVDYQVNHGQHGPLCGGEPLLPITLSLRLLLVGAVRRRGQQGTSAGIGLGI